MSGSAGLSDGGSAGARPERFLELLEPVKGSLLAYCRQMLWLADDCEDVLQAALAAAFADFGRYQEGTNFPAWIFAYVQNIAYATNRKRQAFYRRHDEHVDPAELGADHDESDRESAHHAVVAGSTGVYEHFDDRVKRSLLRLPEAERAALLLRAIGGFSYKEIAVILDKPIGSVMSSLSRARESMRGYLAGYPAEVGWQAQQPGGGHGLQ